MTEDAADFRPLLAELGAGGGPTDIAVYDDPTQRRYVLASTPAAARLKAAAPCSARLR